MIARMGVATAALAMAMLQGCAPKAGPAPVLATAALPSYDLLIRSGTIYDGSGNAPYEGDIGIRGDRIAYAGPALPANATRVVDAHGLAVTPGFINMLSWATESLLVDGLGQSDLRQGVTLEVMGEGWSMGPLNDQMKKLSVERQGDSKFPIEWTTLGEYLSLLERRGTTMNIASFVGATTDDLAEDAFVVLREARSARPRRRPGRGVDRLVRIGCNYRGQRLRDVDELLERAGSKLLAGWGEAKQALSKY